MATPIEIMAVKLAGSVQDVDRIRHMISRRVLSYNEYEAVLVQGNIVNGVKEITGEQSNALIFAQGELNAYQTWVNTDGQTKQWYQSESWHKVQEIIRNLEIMINLLQTNLELYAPKPVTPEPVTITGEYGGQFTFLEPVVEPAPVIVEPTPVIITPTVDDSINTNMVSQQVINFNIVNGRAVGSIKFVATNNFNPYYYNKEIINIVQFKTPNGSILLTKQNRLRFTLTERDEVINYNENIQENTRITVESFVWEWMDKPAGAFSNMYSVNISETEPPKPISSGFMGAGVAGAIAGLVLLGFIVDSKGVK